MARGGPQPGAGRPKGSQNKSTLEKHAAQRRADAILRQIVLERLDRMAAAQGAHAEGVSYMVLRHPDGTFTRATDEKEIDAALASGGQSFQIFTQSPNTPAFVALMDRAFDKPIERVNVEHSGEVSITDELKSARARHDRLKR